MTAAARIGPRTRWGEKRGRTLSLSNGCWDALMKLATQEGLPVSEVVERLAIGELKAAKAKKPIQLQP